MRKITAPFVFAFVFAFAGCKQKPPAPPPATGPCAAYLEKAMPALVAIRQAELEVSSNGGMNKDAAGAKKAATFADELEKNSALLEALTPTPVVKKDHEELVAAAGVAVVAFRETAAAIEKGDKEGAQQLKPIIVASIDQLNGAARRIGEGCK